LPEIEAVMGGRAKENPEDDPERRRGFEGTENARQNG